MLNRANEQKNLSPYMSLQIFQQSHLPSNVTSQIDCLVRQYDSYTDLETGIKNNGRNTLQGNIADNGSLKAVYSAYKKWIFQNGREPSLPALAFTNERFFWISFTQLFCSISRPEKIKNLNAINLNSLERFRVIGKFNVVVMNNSAVLFIVLYVIPFSLRWNNHRRLK